MKSALATSARSSAIPGGSLALVVLLALSAYAGVVPLALAGIVSALALALGWPELTGLQHAARSTSAVIAVSGVAAAIAAAAFGGGSNPLEPIAALMAASVLLAFGHQLMRRDGRQDLVESLTATVAGQALVVMSSGWVLMSHTVLGADGVVVAGAAVAAVAVSLAAPLPRRVRGWAAAGFGLLISWSAVALLSWTGNLQGPVQVHLLMGAAVAGVSAAAALLLAAAPLPSPRALISMSATPVCAAGLVAYGVARLAG